MCVEERVHAGQLHRLAQTPGLRQACPYMLTASSSQGAGACLSLLQSSVHSSRGHSPGDTQRPPFALLPRCPGWSRPPLASAGGFPADPPTPCALAG